MPFDYLMLSVYLVSHLELLYQFLFYFSIFYLYMSNGRWNYAFVMEDNIFGFHNI